MGTKVFESNLEELTPSRVIFYILEKAAFEGRADTIEWHNVDVEKDIDEYIDRLLHMDDVTVVRVQDGKK